jgi:hypothetical protein
MANISPNGGWLQGMRVSRFQETGVGAVGRGAEVLVAALLHVAPLADVHYVDIAGSG